MNKDTTATGSKRQNATFIAYGGPVFVVGQGYVDQRAVSEVDALELALLRWHDVVLSSYGKSAASQFWRRACKVVADFESGL